MVLARFVGLRRFAVDAGALGPWWAGRLEPEVAAWLRFEGDAAPKVVKDRVHLDLRAPSLRPFDGLDRVPTGPADPWTTFRDPEGSEFCVFLADVPSPRVKTVEVDAVDARAIARWWHAVWGGTLRHRDDWSSIDGVPGLPCDGIGFGPVPEPKTVTNRLQWEIALEDGVTIQDLVAAGATVLGPEPRGTVMADPEGNEFAVVPRRSAATA